LIYLFSNVLKKYPSGALFYTKNCPHFLFEY